MAWSTPKTDWVSTDKVNAVDYNRWKNNLAFIRDFAYELFGDFSTVTLYDDKTRAFVPLASELNALETILDQINAATYNLAIGEKQTYYINHHPLNHEEMNRIEGMTLLIYRTLTAQKNAKRHLAFRLGSERTFDVPRV